MRPKSLIWEAIGVILALFTAGGAAATVFTGTALLFEDLWVGIDPGYVTFLWAAAFIGAIVHAALLALPAFLILRFRGWTQWWTSLICGFVIGSLPYAVFFFPPWDQPASFAQVGSSVLVENGKATALGWVFYAGSAVSLGIIGMISGFGAWLTWYWLGRLTGTRPSAADPPPIRPQSQWPKNLRP